jgi:hypothetical protein
MQEELMKFPGHCSGSAAVFFLLLSSLHVFQNVPLTVLFSLVLLTWNKLNKIILSSFIIWSEKNCCLGVLDQGITQGYNYASATRVLCFLLPFKLVSSQQALGCFPAA